MKSYKQLFVNRIQMNPYLVFQGYMMLLLFAGILTALISFTTKPHVTTVTNSRQHHALKAPIILSINKAGQYSINTLPGHPVLTWSELQYYLATQVKQGNFQKNGVWLQSDGQIEYGRVSRLIEALHTLGITQISLLTPQTN